VLRYTRQDALTGVHVSQNMKRSFFRDLRDRQATLPDPCMCLSLALRATGVNKAKESVGNVASASLRALP
jgi:hypothetical protein